MFKKKSSNIIVNQGEIKHTKKKQREENMTVRSEHIKVQTIYKRNLFDDQINAKLNDFKIDVTLEIICVYNCG